ncbi:MAG TPA: acetylglutamate kinase [Candidatus Melainabacteria bacterium]|nr:acetylglutamate kinase [Candidatus Melainabacteria bacterium]
MTLATFKGTILQENYDALPNSTFGLSTDGDPIVVVKFGGNAIMNPKVLDQLIEDTCALINQGVRVVLVHGGGTAVNDALKAVGKETKKVGGLRVTDDQTLSIAVDVFSSINEKLTDKFLAKGAQALSFCSKTINPFVSKKMEFQDTSGSVDLGWVGEIVDVDVTKLDRWLWAGWMPVISPFGMDGNGQLYNLNADHAALAVATYLNADALIFLTDVPGVLRDVQDPTTRISHLTPAQAQVCVEEGTISGGMLPKIKSCLKCLDNGVEKIAILNSFAPHALLKGFSAPDQYGTVLTRAS